MTKGIDIGDAALQILANPFADRPGGPTIDQATAQLDHIKATNYELREAVAYLALQAHAYKRMSNLDASLALSQIRSIVSEYEKRTTMTNQEVPADAQ